MPAAAFAGAKAAFTSFRNREISDCPTTDERQPLTRTEQELKFTGDLRFIRCREPTDAGCHSRFDLPLTCRCFPLFLVAGIELFQRVDPDPLYPRARAALDTGFCR
jgi:hypothetical protein